MLVLGWNHRVPTLLAEFAAYPDEAFSIDIVSQVSAAKREKRIKAEALSMAHLEIRQLEFDYTVPAYLESVDPASYDTLVLLPSERLKSEAESDARTILGYLLLRELMEGGEKAPAVLVELTDPDNAALFENRRGEVIVTPLIISRMLAPVSPCVASCVRCSTGCSVRLAARFSSVVSRSTNWPRTSSNPKSPTRGNVFTALPICIGLPTPVGRSPSVFAGPDRTVSPAVVCSSTPGATSACS